MIGYPKYRVNCVSTGETTKLRLASEPISISKASDGFVFANFGDCELL